MFPQTPSFVGSLATLRPGATSVHTPQSTAPPKKANFKEPSRQDLIKSNHTVSSACIPVDPLDKVRAQAYRDACCAAYFGVEKAYKAEDLIQELDKKLTGGRIGDMTVCTGGVKMLWNKRLTITAGLAKCKDGASPSAIIELSDKFIDDQERLLNTVAYEFCHVANILISGDLRSHGSGFHAWGRACEAAFSEVGIKVTRTHDYIPKFEFIWTCTNNECGEEIGYHSKRLDLKKDRCRHCGDFLTQTNPVARVLKSRREWNN